MTRRQINIGVTAYGIEQVKKGNLFADHESFLAWMATVKKGQYRGRDICRKMYKVASKYVGFEVEFSDSDFWRFQTMCNGLSYTHPEYFHYTDTLGLDILTIR